MTVPTSLPSLHGKVLVLSLGGTIAMAADGGGGVRPALDADDLVAAVPEVGEVAEVVTHVLARAPSAHLRIDDVLSTADVLAWAAGQGCRGAVVTQGTDTLEEVAFGLDLLCSGDMPVVVTGAMRHPRQPGSDGPGNLLAAVQVAAAAAARDLGVLAVMADEVHAARYVRKAHASAPHAFVSWPGPLGYLAEGRPRVLLRPERLPGVPRPVGAGGAVALVSACLDLDPRVLTALAGELDGVVLAGLGAGHVPAAVAAAVSDVVARVPLVLTSRTGSGSVLASTYHFPGAESDLLGRGALSGGHLSGVKARVLLSLLLRAGVGRAGLAEHFRRWGGT